MRDQLFWRVWIWVLKVEADIQVRKFEINLEVNWMWKIEVS